MPKGTPQFRLMLWRQIFDTTEYQQSFESPKETVFAYKLPATVDIVVNRALSKSYVAVLSEDQKLKVQDDVQAIVKKGDDLVWKDEQAGVFEYPYKTWLVVCQRKH